ncbi:MAG: hypothetical protein N2489_09000 [Clostridia bacterium]|nr:hypothetical protein [Clostridia bacterium]
MRDKERFLSKMSLGDVLDYSIEVYKRNFSQLTLLVLICYMPFTLLQGFFAGGMLSEYGSLFKNIFSGISASPNEFEDFAKNPGTSYWVFYLLSQLMNLIYIVYSFTIMLVMDAAIIKIVYSDVIKGTSEKAVPTLKNSFKKMGPLALNKLIYWLIVGAIYFVSLIVLVIIAVFFSIAFFGVAAGQKEQSVFLIAAAVIVGILIFLGFLITTAYFAVRFVLGKIAVVIEDIDGAKGISRSWQLTKGRFWLIVLTLTIGGGLVYFIPFIVTVSSFALGFFGKAAFILGYVASQLLSSIFYPFIWILMTMLFINLKVEKEGLDLEVKVDRLLEEKRRKEENGLLQ